MNELAMNLTAERVDNGYLQVFIVSQAISVKCSARTPQYEIASALSLNSGPIRSAAGRRLSYQRNIFAWLSTLVCVGREPILVPEQDA